MMLLIGIPTFTSPFPVTIEIVIPVYLSLNYKDEPVVFVFKFSLELDGF